MRVGDFGMGSGELVGTRVTLRVVCVDFLSEYCRMFSVTVRTVLHVSSLYVEGKYVLRFCHNKSKKNVFFYCIFDNTTQQLIGAVAIRDVQESAGQLYAWINEQFWGGGRYQEALTLACEQYFTLTQFCVLTAHVDMSNKRSYYALKKNGFADVALKNGPYGKQYVLVLRKKNNMGN
jgi:RimJ/RimL family protein N-acetyltransferase